MLAASHGNRRISLAVYILLTLLRVKWRQDNSLSNNNKQTTNKLYFTPQVTKSIYNNWTEKIIGVLATRNNLEVKNASQPVNINILEVLKEKLSAASL